MLGNRRRVCLPLLAAVALCGMGTAMAGEIDVARGAGEPDLSELRTAVEAVGHALVETTVPGSAAERHAGLVSMLLGGDPPAVVLLDIGRDAEDLAAAGVFTDLGDALAAAGITARIEAACVMSDILACVPVGGGQPCRDGIMTGIFFPSSDDPAIQARQYLLAAALFDPPVAEALGSGSFCTLASQGQSQ